MSMYKDKINVFLENFICVHYVTDIFNKHLFIWISNYDSPAVQGFSQEFNAGIMLQ